MDKTETLLNEVLVHVPEERLKSFRLLHSTILENLPDGFEVALSYGGIGYVVPHSVYPDGYHCNPKDPLPFAWIVSQKNSINFYHMGIYADRKLYDWWGDEYPKYCDKKLDMGKSCIRFKKWDAIPFSLIGELMKKMSMEEWIALYEKNFKRKNP